MIFFPRFERMSRSLMESKFAKFLYWYLTKTLQFFILDTILQLNIPLFDNNI